MTEQLSNLTTPKIRFPEFTGAWEEKKLGEVVKRTISKNKDLSIKFVLTNSATQGIVSQREYFDKDIANQDNLEGYYIVRQDDFVYNPRISNDAPVGPIKRNHLCDGIMSPLYTVFAFTKGNLDFFEYYFSSTKWYQYLKSVANYGVRYDRMNISNDDLFKMPIPFPTLPEQQKIADFLSVINEKIGVLTKEYALMQAYKKGMMQRIFSQTLRFTDDNGHDYPDWEEKTLGKVFERVIRKNIENNQNVLTISAQHGLINQQEFFNKSVSAENVTSYYLLHKNEFAYNKSYSKGYPMGAIKKLNRYDKGVVSTLYICFKIKKNNDARFFEVYFDSGIINGELHKIAQEGARNHGLLNLSVVEFFKDIKLIVPTLSEQQKIADFLTAIDDKINLVKKQLDKTKDFKKGLLQKMFV